MRAGGAKLGFVYCSGVWVHGSSFENISDLDPVGTADVKTQTPKLVGWRPRLERDVLAARDVLDVAVVRPAKIYGREHAIWSTFFKIVQEAGKSGHASASIPLDPLSRPGLVHIE